MIRGGNVMSHSRVVSALKMINVGATHANTYVVPTCPASDLGLKHTHTHRTQPGGRTRVRLIPGRRGKVSDTVGRGQ